MRYTISVALASLLAGPALAEVPRVVTDLPPVHSLVAQVMGDLGEPDLLLGQGADPHSFQLRPSQARALANADLVVWIGPEMTRWLERALEGRKGEELRLMQVAGTHLQDFGEGAAHDHAGHGHDHADEDHDHAGEGHEHADEGHAGEAHDHADEGHTHGDEAHDHGEHEGHSHTGLDPHAWLDPENAQLWLTAVARELGHLDPENAATYAANAEAARAALAELDRETAARLDEARNQPFYVFHDAYGYFAGHYGLTVQGSVSAGDAAAPGAAHLADLRAEMAGTPRCIFPEAQHDAKLARQIAQETGAKAGPALDPSGSTLEPGPQLYANLIRGLADGILSCVAP
ncbi:zinc ABC transporter solute-binding protein [Rhodobacter sphaeroides]|uniref:High-affinity zinc uptake system protein ZnuA n=1 Tax=Cereibacter sphaeroides (strain ATCC 17023 / DSM 158 / JCM 6121 / CCUG 31486 / LMG 2827 / NBRC 12203 / NCIMB 8253 / ATH 2.4.1.) TaxID=272943 RepID=Q3IWB3_CERS4|nr:zinc ABC transporter substrate-binding protein [Cereibacter sphaeroides]ABA81171.1 ABC zinc transporter, periplasmic binding protein ZnuA [Cereibacter sphaeroides 2.4.1]AMJ49476.1 zinc ABC transporter substrate-binding protein [Cereibacter sphaeroides]ANS36188.1 zinc ABC transporter substrate-binding protein [Cereibacter sphaeroides]ATN65244.1 zinc ABC transporter substrate-binding protein [Cereibacter sphaeroides]AXC63462.1 zinc ABC transporter substrate-binding protein [Cereibacter sphaer